MPEANTDGGHVALFFTFPEIALPTYEVANGNNTVWPLIPFRRMVSHLRIGPQSIFNCLHV